MNIDRELFERAYELCEKGPTIYKLDKVIIDWLDRIQASKEIIEFFNDFAFSTYVRFGRITFNSPNELKYENEEIENRRIIDNGFLIIGSGLNGDPIVVNLADGSVGYVCHDELWEGGVGEIGSMYTRIRDSIGKFFYDAVLRRDFPVDFHEASNS